MTIKQYHFDGYLRKPISQEALLKEIANFLSHEISISPSQITDDIDSETLVHLPTVIADLERDYLPSWQEIKEMGDFALISDFSLDLTKLADENKILFLKKYAQK